MKIVILRTFLGLGNDAKKNRQGYNTMDHHDRTGDRVGKLLYSDEAWS